MDEVLKWSRFIVHLREYCHAKSLWCVLTDNVLIAHRVRPNSIALQRSTGPHWSVSHQRILAAAHYCSQGIRENLPAAKAASRQMDFLPEPPTPMIIALPRSMRRIRCVRVRCSRQSSNSTTDILPHRSLYSSNILSEKEFFNNFYSTLIHKQDLKIGELRLVLRLPFAH